LFLVVAYQFLERIARSLNPNDWIVPENSILWKEMVTTFQIIVFFYENSFYKGNRYLQASIFQVLFPIICMLSMNLIT
jgi:hypothetical protein